MAFRLSLLSEVVAMTFDTVPGWGLAPDGKSFVYGASSVKSNLWLLEGFEPETGLLSRLGLR